MQTLSDLVQGHQKKAIELVEQLEQSVDPLISIEHLANAGIIITTSVITWFITYFGFSYVWIVVFMFYVAQMYRYQTSRLKTKMRRKAVLEIAKEQMESSAERVEWLNLFLSRYWTMYEPGLSQMIREIVDNSIGGVKPAFIDELLMTQFTLGSAAPRVESIKSYTQKPDDQVEMDFDLKFIPTDDEDLTPRQKKSGQFKNVLIELTAKFGIGPASIPLRVKIQELEFSCLVRLTFNLGTVFPHIRNIQVSLLEPPDIKFQLIPLGSGDINNLASLRAAIDKGIESGLEWMIFPKFLPIDMEGTADMSLETPVGVLRVVIYEAARLRNADIGSLSDPCAVLKIGGKEVNRTRVIMNDLDPKWHQCFNVVIYQNVLEQVNHADELEIDIMHSAKLKPAVLGSTGKLSLAKFIRLLVPISMEQGLGESLFQTDLSKEEQQQMIKVWGTPLHDSGDVWIPLQLDEQPIKSALKADISFFPLDRLYLEHPRSLDSPSGILHVQIVQAKELTSRKQPTPYCSLQTMFGKELYKSPHRKRTNNPVWDFKVEFYTHNVHEARYKFVILDEQGKQPMGEVNVKMMDLIKKKEDWFALFNGSGKLKLQCKFLPIDLSQSLVDKTLIPRKEPCGVLRINMLEAKELHNVEFLGTSDPYCRMYLGKHYVGTTQAIENTLDPEWREAFYDIPFSLDDNLTTELFDYNEMQKDKPLGKFTLKLSMLLLKQEELSFDDQALLDMYAKDGFSCKLKPGTASTIEVWAPLYRTKQDLEQTTKEEPKQHSLVPGDSFFKSSFRKEPTLLKEFKENRSKLRHRGKVHFELDFFSTKPEFAIKSDFTPPMDKGTIVEKVESPESKKSEDWTQKEQELERRRMEAQESIQKILTLNVDGILRVHLEYGSFSRPGMHYLEFRVGDEIVYTTRAWKESTFSPEWNEVHNCFVRFLGQSPLSIVARTMRGSEKADDDDILAVWSGNAAHVLGKASYRLELRQRTIQTYDMDQLPEVGYIYLSLSYTPVSVTIPLNAEDDEGILQFDIIQASGVIAADSNGTSDPFVVCKINGKQFYKTKTIQRTLNPVWNEKASVEIFNRQSSLVLFEVYDANLLGKSVLLGKYLWNIGVLEPRLVQSQAFSLDTQGKLEIRWYFDPVDLTPKGINMEKHLKSDKSAVKKFAKGLASGISFKNKNKTARGSSIKLDSMEFEDKSSRSSLSDRSKLKSRLSQEVLNEDNRKSTDQLSEKSLEAADHRRVRSLQELKSGSLESIPEKSHQPPSVTESQTSQPPFVEEKPVSGEIPTIRLEREATELEPPRHTRTASTVSENILESPQSSEDGPQGTIVLHIIEARNLKAVDSNGLSDPFVKIRHDKEKSFYKTSIIKKSLNPVWTKETCEFAMPPNKVVIDVRDHNMFSEKKLGMVELDLNLLFQQHDEFDEWFELDDGGKIHLSAKLTRNTSPIRKSSSRTSIGSMKRLFRK
ncbi:C2 domain-containing protein [Gorgonomyces haynaldii]|nr:C2 domain-containing protein [Gorgonomyces haynaldii]